MLNIETTVNGDEMTQSFIFSFFLLPLQNTMIIHRDKTGNYGTSRTIDCREVNRFFFRIVVIIQYTSVFVIKFNV